jgi:hypothetical protein
MNGNAEVRNGGILGMWRDLTTEPAWRYEELPPLLLAELTEQDLFEDDTELARARWFWSRRPKLTLHDRAAPVAVGTVVLLYLVVAFAVWPETSMPKAVTEMVILLLDLAVMIELVVERIRFVRWRRDYELSVDRLIRNIHPGCEGGSAI